VGAVVIASGHLPDTIIDICDGATVGTLFSAKCFDEGSISPRQQAALARDAARRLYSLDSSQRATLLRAVAAALLKNAPAIISENQKDIELAAKMPHLSQATRDRLVLTETKLKTVCEGIIQLAAQPDPLSRVLRKTELSAGLILRQEAAPIGVLLVVFESRPDALPQITSLGPHLLRFLFSSAISCYAIDVFFGIFLDLENFSSAMLMPGPQRCRAVTGCC